MWPQGLDEDVASAIMIAFAICLIIGALLLGYSLKDIICN